MKELPQTDDRENVRKIPLEKLIASPTQPRTNFDPEKLKELVDSVREHGIIQPLVVRERKANIHEGIADAFEIVLGERRFRAARELKLAHAPCWIRELSDTDVIEQQLIENLQRDDLNPIEEAISYRRTLDLRDGNGDPRHTLDSIAKKIGRKRNTVYRSLALCELDPETQAEVITGNLPAMTAYLIAQIPDVARRSKAAQEILHPKLKTGPLSFRDADEHIFKYYMRDLRYAKFDQDNADLVEVRFDEAGKRIAGGSCRDCPFKTANLPGEEIQQRKNRCLNPACFDEKEDAEWAQWQALETDPAKKRRALNRVESAAVFSGDFPDQPVWKSGYVSLDQYPASDELRVDEEAPGTWRAMIAGKEAETIVARDRKGNTHELVERTKAIEAAKLNGHDVFKGSGRESGAAPVTRKSIGLEAPADLGPEKGKSLEQTQEEWLNHAPSKDEETGQRKIKEKARAEAEALQKSVVFVCLEALRKKAKFNTGFLRKIAIFLFTQRNSVNEDLLKRHKLPVATDIARNVTKWRDADLIAFIVDLIVTDAGYNFELDGDDHAWFKLFGVDCAAEEKRQRALAAKFKKADNKALAKATAETPAKKKK